jgi:predicted metal-dependent hydrolase
VTMETLELSDLVFEVRRSPRRATLGLTVDRGGELVIHAPESSDRNELARWTRSKLLWVHRKLLDKSGTLPRLREPEFVSGESFSYLGRSYRLKVVRGADESLRFDGKNFLLSATARSQATDHFRRWYVQIGRLWLRERVNLLSRKVGVAAARVDVRDLGYRWGSCGKNGAVYFNWKLLQLPARVTDYVIAHELAHLLERHHGPEFWKILDRSLPDWRDRSEDLKVRARTIHWCNDRMHNR